jgi:hypothetical protein
MPNSKPKDFKLGHYQIFDAEVVSTGRGWVSVLGRW